MKYRKHIDLTALTMLLVLVVAIREGCVRWASAWGLDGYGNLMGLALFFVGLKLYHMRRPLSHRFLHTYGVLMKESGLAFLPYIAGVASAVGALGASMSRFSLVLVLSTVIPLFLYAYWLGRSARQDTQA